MKPKTKMVHHGIADASEMTGLAVALGALALHLTGAVPLSDGMVGATASAAVLPIFQGVVRFICALWRSSKLSRLVR